MRTKVYIASAYSIGNKNINVELQLLCANNLIKAGFVPFVPLLSHYQNLLYPQPYEKWLELDLYWVQTCDCVLRTPGESKGADREVAFAKENNIPVFYSIKALVESYIKE